MKDRLQASFFALLCATAFLTAACGSSGSDSAPLTPGAVEIQAGDGLSFNSPHITVAAGTTVRWRNVGQEHGHTVTSGTSSKAADRPGAEFDAELPQGGTFEFVFDEVGDHPYFCRPHEAMGMKGVVTVIPAGTDAGTASSAASGDASDAGSGGGYGY